MSEVDPKIVELESRLDRLIRSQIDFQTEISAIRVELSRLRIRSGDSRTMETARRPQAPELPERWSISPPAPPTFETSKLPHPKAEEPTKPLSQDVDTGQRAHAGPRSDLGTRRIDGSPPSESTKDSFSASWSASAESARSDLERFIGENLISKIGILILVIGVGIGAKYAIDNGWISPMLRIVLGYLIGLGLIGFAVRLKSKYLNFSAVLLSGGMAIMYFVTYFAYASYSLIGQPPAFGLMVLFTIITVTAALVYDRHVIAHIGLVGAYAVPFLLSNDSGNYFFLFVYMAVVNTGILAISVKKYWKSLFYTSSLFTWLIFGSWFAAKYSAAEHFYLALVFLGVFFFIFYAAKIVHGIVQPAATDSENLASLVITTLIFYGFCLALSDVKASVFDYSVFFSYLAGSALLILLTSYRFYGRILVFIAYPLTWLIYAAWFFFRYNQDEHFALAAVFAGVLFGIFYVSTLIFRVVTDEIGMVENTGLVLTNSFIFYGFGYALLDSRETLRGFEGVFTVGHAAFHSLVSQVVSRVKATAVDVVQVLTVLVLTFSTIAIPVQFDGNFVTLIWSVEAAILFAFGRIRQITLFEYLTFPVMILATVSLGLDWIGSFLDRISNPFNIQPFSNGDFITALVFVAAFAFIYSVNRDGQKTPAIGDRFVRPVGYAIATVALLVLYNSFRIEIGNYYNVRSIVPGRYSSGLAMGVDPVWDRFSVIWQMNYTMFFLITMAAVNLRRVGSSILAKAGGGFSLVTLLVFVTAGMQLFFELRESYMAGDVNANADPMSIAIRYISFLFAAGLLFSLYRYSRSELLTTTVPENKLSLAFDAVLYTTVLIVVSCDLVNVLKQLNIADSMKLGLSIFWAVYALFLIAVGIAKLKKHLRIAAMVLLAVTLTKLFLYDIADLPTIPKTILFVSIGLLMLVASFLYNKYTASISNVESDQPE